MTAGKSQGGGRATPPGMAAPAGPHTVRGASWSYVGIKQTMQTAASITGIPAMALDTDDPITG